MVNNTNDKLPFAKLKNYSLQNEKPNAIKTNKKEEKKDDRIYYKNKILYLGKMINYSILQHNTKKIIVPYSGGTPFGRSNGESRKGDGSAFSQQATTKYDDYFTSDADAQKNVMNYRMFKNLKIKSQ